MSASEMTTQAKREYVERFWSRVIVCDGSYRNYDRGTVLINWANHRFYDFVDWDAAYVFTKERERKIAEIEEEIAVISCLKVTVGDWDTWQRILAREQAALQEVRRGMRKEGANE